MVILTHFDVQIVLKCKFSYKPKDNPNAPSLILLRLNVPENTYWLRISFSIQETHMQVMFQ